MSSPPLPPEISSRAPVYVLDLECLATRYRAFVAAFVRHFPDVAVGYSYKTNCLPFLCQFLHRLDARAEVVSALEYELARRLGVAGPDIVFNGPAKDAATIERALDEGALIHLDSREEVELAAARLRVRALEAPARLGLRVALDVAEGYGPPRPSRFGLSLESGELSQAARALLDAGSGPLGLHVHRSSKARSLEIFRRSAEQLARAAGEIGGRYVASLDIGGGFGFAPARMATLSFPRLEEYAAVVHDGLQGAPAEARSKPLILEPGIALVGDSFALVTRVHAVKSRGERTLVTLDASVHTVRPTRHRHPLPIRVFDADGNPKEGATRPHELVGYTCMEDDVIAEGVALPALAAGDLLEIGNVGAYVAVFKPRFIRTAPPVVARIDGAWREVQTAETFEEFFHGTSW